MNITGINESIEFLKDYGKTLELIQANPLSNYFTLLANNGTPRLFFHLENLISNASAKENYQETQRILRSILLKDDVGLLNLAVRDGQHTIVTIDQSEFPSTLQGYIKTGMQKQIKVSFYEMVVLKLLKVSRMTLDNYLWNDYMSNLFFDILAYIKETDEIHIERFFILFENMFIFDLELSVKNRGIYSLSNVINDYYMKIIDRYFCASYQYVQKLKKYNNTLRYMKSVKKVAKVISDFFMDLFPVFTVCTVSYQAVLESYNNALQLFLYEEDDVIPKLYSDCFLAFIHYTDKNADFFKQESVKGFSRCVELVRLYCLKFKYPENKNFADNYEVLHRILYKMLQNVDIALNDIYIENIAKILNMESYTQQLKNKISQEKEKKKSRLIGLTQKSSGTLKRNWNSQFDHKYESMTSFWLCYYFSCLMDKVLGLTPFDPYEEEAQKMYYNGKLDVYINPMLRGKYIPRFNIRFLANKQYLTALFILIIIALWFGLRSFS